MISVEEALQRILGSLSPGSTETVSIADAVGRVLARDLFSRRTHPPTGCVCHGWLCRPL